MDTINEAFQRHQSRRKFLGNISIIGMGAAGANILATNNVAAQTNLPSSKLKTIKNESNRIKR